MVMPPDDRSFSDLLADALNRLTTLVRTEINSRAPKSASRSARRPQVLRW
jgi:hypothetical protein